MRPFNARRRAPVAAALLLLLAAGGCGGDAVRVSGKLVKDGKPYTARLDGPEPETLSIDFVGGPGGNLLLAASVSADGTFTVPGPTGRGVPRGTYKITVLHSGFLGAGGDRFRGRFAADKTPLSIDITEPANLVIDLGTGTVTR
jgi:hypothetical protein